MNPHEKKPRPAVAKCVVCETPLRGHELAIHKKDISYGTIRSMRFVTMPYCSRKKDCAAKVKSIKPN